MSFLGWFTSGFVSGGVVAGYACLHAVHTLPTSACKHPWEIGALLSVAASVIALACVNEWFPSPSGCFGRRCAACGLGGVGFFCPFLLWEALVWLI